MTSHEAAYVHDLLSYINKTELYTCLWTNSSYHGFLTKHMHADSWEVILHSRSSSQMVLTLLSIPLCMIMALFMQPKHKLQMWILNWGFTIKQGPNFCILNVGKFLRSRNLQLRTTLHYLCGVLVRTASNETEIQETLKSRHLKLGLYCIYNTGHTKICSLHTYNLYHVLIIQC